MTTPTQDEDGFVATRELIAAAGMEIARLRAANAALTEALKRISRVMPDRLEHAIDVAIIERMVNAARAALASVEVPK